MARMTASQLYALSQSDPCTGDMECHWCGGPCKRWRFHDDPPPVPFVKRASLAKKPNELFVCNGCWMFRRPRVTVTFLTGSYKDGQAPMNHSWWLTPASAHGLRKDDSPALWEILLRPPPCFTLSLIDGEKQQNHIQQAVVNQVEKVEYGTELEFTVNGVLYAYSVYEVSQAVFGEPNGKMAGVRVLLDLLGLPPEGAIPAELEQRESSKPIRQRGRPRKDDTSSTPNLTRRSA